MTLVISKEIEDFLTKIKIPKWNARIYNPKIIVTDEFKVFTRKLKAYQDREANV